MKIEILLKEVRKKKGYSLEKLSKLTGISSSHLNYIENNQKEPSISILVRIALALNVKIEELYKVIPQHNKNVLFFIFVKEKVTFVKYPPQWIRFNIFIHQERSKNKGVYGMKDVVLDEVVKELNFRERIIVKVFRKTFIKVYKSGIKYGYNWNNYSVH